MRCCGSRSTSPNRCRRPAACACSTSVGRIVRTSTTGHRASHWRQEVAAYWANGYDSAPPRSGTQPLRPVHHHDRWTRHPLRSPAIAPTRRAPVADHARLAGSIVEFHKVIEPLVDPVGLGGDRRRVPCHRTIPAGLRLLGKADVYRLGVERIGAAWATLMARLNYPATSPRGRWGSAITTEVGAQDPEHCAAIHISSTCRGVQGTADGARRAGAAGRGRALPEMGLGVLDAATNAAADARVRVARLASRSAGLDPQKFWAWTDCDGDPEHGSHTTNCSTT